LLLAFRKKQVFFERGCGLNNCKLRL
jgi:hypothetical protein